MVDRGRTTGFPARMPPFVLAALGVVLGGAVVASVVRPAPDAVAWWVAGLLLVPALVLVLAGLALVIDPRPLGVRQALAAAGLLWLMVLVGGLLLWLAEGGLTLGGLGTSGERGAFGGLVTFGGTPVAGAAVVAALAAIDAGALLALAATTPRVADGTLPGPLGRVAAVVVFAVAIAAAAVVIIVVVSIGLAAWDVVVTGSAAERLPWGAVALVLVLPAVTFAIATLLTRRAAGGTFHAQAAANRRTSLLLLVTLVAVVAATAEIVAVVVTFNPVPALWAAGIATLIGLGAAVGAERFGADIVLQTAGARPADPSREGVLLNVVREISLGAGIPEPRVFVVEDGSMNAFATGRDPAHASVAVTRGLLERLDREQLQGVVGHELGHVRNLDTRYALYVAILVGLIALVTDGFLRAVVEGWRQGAFIWTGGDDARAAIAGFVSGIAVGLFLLVVAAVLRVVAPLFSLLVQAAVSREREFLADATSVELTRNPAGLQRALAAIASDRDELEAANRGTQHLWFRNPVKAGSDRRTGLFSTHPSIGARIGRLARLQGVEPAVDGRALARLDEET